MALASSSQSGDHFRVECLSEDATAEWDRFVFSHPQGTLYHSSEWRTVLRNSFPHLCAYFLALRDRNTGRICGGLPIYHVQNRWRGDRLVSVPHASFCQPLLENPAQGRHLVDRAVELGRSLHAQSVELRWMESDVDSDRESMGRVRSFLHHHLPLNRPLNELWHSLSRTAVRRMIHKAEKSGVTVEAAEGDGDLRGFHELLMQTRHRLGLPATPYALLHDSWTNLPPAHRALLLARRAGNVLGGVFATKAGPLYMLEHYGESLDARGDGVNSLLYWRAVCQAHAGGFSCFSFGRTECTNAGLSDYKRHWDVTEEKLCYREISLQPVRAQRSISWLSRDWLRSVLRQLPMPLYEGVSKVFYRNWT